MKYELRKILDNRYYRIILLLAVLTNSFFLLSVYGGDQNGFSLYELKEAYTTRDNLEEKQADLNAAIFGFSDYQRALLTGDIYKEYRLVNATLERITESREYRNHLNDILAELQIKTNSGLFGDAESYSVKAFRAVMQHYEKLRSIEIPVAFSGTIETLSNWQVSDILIQLFCCTASLLLMTNERQNGSLNLLFTTKHGRSKLYIQKYIALEAIFALLFILMHGCNIILSCMTLGYGDLRRPIQSVYGFSKCPFAFTVFGYFVFFYSIKFLWGLCVSTLFFAFCSTTDKGLVPILALGCVFLLSYACESCRNLYLYCLNFIHLAKTEVLFMDCIMLNFGGQPVSQFIVLFFELILITLVSFLLGMLTFCKKQVVSKARSKRGGRGLPLHRHTNLFVHEGFKIYIHNRALVILAFFALIQLCVYQNFTIRLDETEIEYKRYSDILSGLPNEEKGDFLEREATCFEDLEMQLLLLEEKFGENEAILSLLTRDTEQELLRKEAFSLAKDQYDTLQDGMSYVYRSGYERLNNTQGIKDNIRNTALFLFFLLLILSGVFSLEHETGVCIIQNSFGVFHRVMRKKWLHIIGIILIASIIAFLPQYIVIDNKLGLNEVGAMAHSLSCFSEWPSNWTIAMVLMLTNFVRVSIGLLSAIATYFIAKRVGNTIITLLISLGLCVFPLIIALLFV